MKTKGMRQVERIAGMRLAGLATCERWEGDVLVVRAKRLATVREAQSVAQELADALGWEVVVVF